MGAHSTFEQALKGVTEFATAVASDSESEGRSKSKKHKKIKSKKDKKEKTKKNSRHEDDEKKKKSKKRRRATESSEEEPESLEVQLERGRAAVRCTRQLVSHFPAAKSSLRQMFWRLDNREAVNTAGIPDQHLRGLLQVLFEYLNLLRVKEGVYVRRKKSEAVLRQIGFVLDETPAEPSALPAKEQAGKPEASVPELQSPKFESPKLNSASEGSSDGADGLDESAEMGTPAKTHSAETVGVSIGPQIPEEHRGELQQAQEAVEKAAELEAKKRRVGPAMPPPELLAQAAEVAEAMAVEEAAIAAETMIGPPPPELVAETEATSTDARTAEVSRVLKVLEAAARADKQPDAYDVVGVEPEAGAGDIKKRYWRLSLMIHPDKCDHPRAQDAFNAVSQAAKALQDAGKREEIDKGREKAEFEAFAEAELQKQERERQWRVAQGKATPEDLRGPLKSGPATREEWITVLPAANRPSAPSQKSQTAFSQQGVAALGQDASSWSDTPAEKLLRLQAAGVAMLTSTEPVQAKAARTAQAVDTYNESHRSKPLMEQHSEKQHKERRKKEKKQKTGSEGPREQEGWESSHPWRPFDREKDLQVSSRPTNPAQFAKQMGDLTSRFGGNSSASRKFL